ncbi:MAG: DUF5107 domain-containing protein [Bifidobacteriaceae bacterium]|jgi:hypothetical protein|nr:DUF5107 domain-containing protein [Bifidobacteriaceae bacterium]
MDILEQSIILPGVDGIGVSPLPGLRDQRVHLPVESNGSLLPNELPGLGRDTARRVLPYLTQDRYGRANASTELSTIVLDNGVLRAAFLPGLGGRLYSLTDLCTGRDLLFTNPVFQPANLAIRDAWFSGGIEWNLGQYGHSCATCDPLFAGIVRDRDGQAAALRLWEYERQRGLFWQIDFRLPDGRAVLEAHVRIVNPHSYPVPLYWWTNAAVPQQAGTRVFSGTRQVIYQDTPARIDWVKDQDLPLNSASIAAAPNYFGHAELPWFTEDGRTIDATYPLNYERSSEYFFQLPQDEPAPWEACAQPDGQLFLERSTQPLRFRKMFCWGSHDGGRWWWEFLSRPGEGSYVELQAGLAPTQLHGLTMDAASEVEFTQLFGGGAIDPAAAQGDWDEARRRVREAVDQVIPPALVQAADAAAQVRARVEVRPGDVLSLGSGWGALEGLRAPDSVPVGFHYPADSLGPEQEPWLRLLREGRFTPCSGSFLVDPAWRSLLEGSLARGRDPETLTHLGLLEWEDLNPDRAQELWREAAALGGRLAMRNLAAASSTEDPTTALDWMESAWQAGGRNDDQAYAEEYLALLVDCGRHREAWALFQELPEPACASEKVRLTAGRAALAVGELDYVDSLFESDWAGLREGDNVLIDLWYQAQVVKLAAGRGVEVSDGLVGEVMATRTPPRRIDTRMYWG